MSPDKKSAPSANKSVSISGDVVDSVVIIGDNNKTFFQKVINIFKSDSETLEHRNRRILLGHLENAWIKGVLDASLHGAALLDLGIKQDPTAVTQYPWAIKKESTDETLPAGTSMLEIFDSIGMGRSLLILGAPGSGKTTMLLELARQLISRARENVTYPIPMVFNLASWTEKLTLADWLAQELNNLYSVPRKTAPDWVQGNKLLLLLDGLDEVRQDSRAKCVEAINVFRKEHGLTSLAVCNRSQDYADLNAKLSFEGAIEVQPLTQEQIAEFFNRFGKEMAGIKQVLKKDSAMREMAETPLFLSIMIMAYWDKQEVNIWVSKDEKAQRKLLFSNYIERMFERPRSKNVPFEKKDVINWLSWLASKMIQYGQVPYKIEYMQPEWLDGKKQNAAHRLISSIFIGLIEGSFFGILLAYFHNEIDEWLNAASKIGPLNGPAIRISLTILIGLGFMAREWVYRHSYNTQAVNKVTWSWRDAKKEFTKLLSKPYERLWSEAAFYIFSIICGSMAAIEGGLNNPLLFGLMLGTTLLFLSVLLPGGIAGIQIHRVDQTTRIGQGIKLLYRDSLISLILVGSIFTLLFEVTFGLIFWLMFNLSLGFTLGLIYGLYMGLSAGLGYGGMSIFHHYTLRCILRTKNHIPLRLIPFLNYATDLIFLRRVGGGYIFVHRLLMEHFAEMYVESPTSKGN